MRIAILQHFIAGTGGAQKVVDKVANYLLSRSHHVEIFTQKYDKKTAYDGFKKIKINILKPSQKIFSPFVFLFKKIKDFDVLILNDFPSNFASIRNKPTLWICYSPRRYFYDLRKFYFENASFFRKIILFSKILFFKEIDMIAAKKATIITPISKTVRERVKKNYKRDCPIFYPGIDFNNYRQGRYDDYFICVSRLVNAKRVDMVIKSMSYVKNKKIKLYVIGDGPERENIEKLAKKNKNVILLGSIDDKKLIELYSDCLGAIYSPLNEDWGLVPLEAGASGKLTIGVNEGGLRETVIDRKTGFLINNVNPKKIAEKINFLVKNKKIALKMGRQARKYVRKFDWKYSLPNLEKLLIKAKNEKLLKEVSIMS